MRNDFICYIFYGKVNFNHFNDQNSNFYLSVWMII